jgi:hypothetical protein
MGSVSVFGAGQYAMRIWVQPDRLATLNITVPEVIRAVQAQNADPTLVREVMAVRDEVARSKEALRQYTWTEHTEVRVKGDLKASNDFICQYDDSGKVTRTPVGKGKEDEAASAISKRYRVRKKADMQDYIERAVGVINTYVPLDPEQIRYLLQDSRASLEPPEAGKSTIRLKDYFQRGDSLAFSYDPASKALLKATVVSTLGSPKDPVSLEAVFETLPDGLTHLATATVNATTKKVQVITRNSTYQKYAE